LLKTIKELKKYEENNYLEGFCNMHGLDYDFYKRFLETSYAIIKGESELVEAIKSDKELAKQLSSIHNVLPA
jgi:hypothetical protein